MRCEFLALLYRYMGEPVYTEVNPFEDVPDGAYFCDAVLWGYENGITKGVDATHFVPGAQCRRAEVVTFLYRFDQLSAE